MKNLDQTYAKIFRSRFIVPFCFAFTLLLTASSIALIMRRSFTDMENSWVFSIGADIFCLAVCSALCFCCMLSRDVRSSHTRTFVTLVTLNASLLFLDEASWLLQGKAAYRAVNLNVNVLFYMIGAVLVYMFWRYLTKALNMRSFAMRVADHSLRLLLIPALLICMANYIYPVYFKITATGNFQRAEFWYISRIYLGIVLLVSIIGMIFSKAPAKCKLTAASFIVIPLINQVITRYTFGITTQYAAVLASVVLLFGVLFAEHDNSFASSETERDIAARMQSDMLPDVSSFMSGKTGFDLYASITPAKNAGGDFYDFFMTDENHLALVIADVSDKGVPSVLFATTAKLLIKSCVTAGSAPAKALENVNRQLLENDKNDLFAAVWLGILDLKSGVLTYSNAGHVFPVLLTPDGGCKDVKSARGLVAGGLPGTEYAEGQMWLRPGSKLFLYSDGLTNAVDGKNNRYGSERLVQALDLNRDKTPEELINAVAEHIGKFTKRKRQPDDLAALCLHYTESGGDETL